MRHRARMRRILMLTLLIALMLAWSVDVPAVYGRAVKRPVNNDSFLYTYFSEVISYFDYSMMYALENNTYSVTLANLTTHRLGMIYKEALYYESKGIPTRAMRVIPPFYSFSKDLVILDELVLRFQRNPSPALAAGIRGLIGSMQGYLTSVSHIELFNGSTVLKFNVNGTRRYLRAISRMISTRATNSSVLLLDVSNTHPILNETIVIFGSAPSNGTVDIFVVGKNGSTSIRVGAPDGMFSVSYKFGRLGEYVVYAVQGSSRSRSVNVTVGKIPVSFLVSPTYSAVIGKTAVLSGRLVDVYGRPIGGEKIVVSRSGGLSSETIITSSSGSFSVNYTSSVPLSFNVSLVYGGDDLHYGARTVVRVMFTKVPVSIVLYNSGERFRGHIEPPLTCNLEVFVNGVKNESIHAEGGNFSFRLRFKVKKRTLVYVRYSGSGKYMNATSNVIYLLPAKSKRFPYALPLVVALAFVGGVIAWRIWRVWERTHARKGDVVIVLKSPVSTGKESAEVTERTGRKEWTFRSIPEAYEFLKRSITEKFGLSQALTPRELVDALKGWEHVDDLAYVTSVHERAVYAGIDVSSEEVEGFVSKVTTLLSILGGAEA